MAPRDRSPSKPFRNRINLRIDYKARRNLTRLIKCLIPIAFTTVLTVMFYNLMNTYAPLPEIPRVDMFRMNVFKFGNPNKKIDWHDYEKIRIEEARKGPGEQGKPGNYSHLSKDLVDQMYKLNGYNGALSDTISIDRSLPDLRHPDCQKKLYRSELPTVSIIIPFHNEHPSTLIRTGKSVLNRSPEQLIKEIIYVDDFSSRDVLKQEFDDYISKNMPKTRVVRLPARRGLIYARTAGAKEATADVLIFLDAHSEATVNWLPPLLEPIAEDYKTCMCPFIDVIDYDTYEYKPQDEGGRGIFNWDLLYKRLPRLKADKNRPAEPFASPVMAGGLFAISAKFFWELGGYDEGLDIWGGEQYELSFKIWQCGGRMLDAPCSRVGHVYRKFGPFPNPRQKDFICVNFRRVAEVWMDEYKQYYYMRHPDCAKQDPGDLTKQLELRRNLQCKSFKWFMEEVAFDLTKKYPVFDPPDISKGFIRNIGYPDQCVEIQKNTIEMRACVTGYWAQKFQYSWHGDIQCVNSNQCWDVQDYTSEKGMINYFACHGAGGNQLWIYDQEKKFLHHNSEGRCMDMDPTTKQIFIKKCDLQSKTQKWELENFNATENQKYKGYVISLKSGLIGNGE